MSYNPKELEEEVKKFWKNNDVKRKVRESTEGNEPFFMIDGPPYLNGAPHVGHMQGKVLKDVMLRYKQMQGFDVWDQAGFDTHGLPNELATEEELGIENKNEIGKSISASKFIKECRERATSAQDLWKGVMEDLAVWQDFEDPYMTYDPDYIESEWWLVKKTWEEDLIYRAKKPIHWCPRCQTSLSGYEVTDEYQEIEDISIFVKFPIENRDEKLLIWTTTPWTIPSNMAIYVHPEFRYARVKLDDEILIIADQLVDKVMEKAGYEEEDYEVLNSFTGVELKGKRYEHPFLEEVPRQEELEEEDDSVHRVHTSDELVSLEEGTGLVHAATGHGQEDYEVTRQIDLPVFSPIDKEGYYTEEAGKFEGEYVLDVDERIVDELEKKGVLFHSHHFEHEYPHCWRCKNQLLMRAADQWFIENDEVKRRMLEENELVDWLPPHAQKRFRKFVEDSPDWCISRQSYWGVPLPIWVCDSCGEKEVVGSFEDLEEKAGGLSDDFDPHKHVVDDISWNCAECGGNMERVPDIMDVWFDSGSAPFASLHYPFDKEPFGSMFPMDFITEASDQIRGWFYHLLFCGILGFDEAPYEKILFQGHVLDAEGKKMSKSLGNVVDPVEQVEEYGADLPRFYSLRVAAPWEQTKYDEEEIENEIYRLFNVYWNTKEFFETHGKLVDEGLDKEDLEIEDLWILSRLNTLLSEVEEKIENGLFHEYTRSLEEFVVQDLSRWYVKSVRSRIKEEDLAANWTLEKVISKANRALAPFVPYITEKVYQDLGGEKLSVHMESYPEEDEEMINEEIEEGMALTRDIVEKANKLRDENQYNLRWPAKRLAISTDDKHANLLQDFIPLIQDMANVETVEFGEVSTKKVAEPVYSEIGPQFGDKAEKVAELIGELEPEQIEQLEDTGEIVIDGFDVKLEHVEVRSRTEEGVENKEFDKGQVYLDLHMTPDIEDKAFVREVIRAVQQKRKDVGLSVEDKVDLGFEGDIEPLEDYEDKIASRINLSAVKFGEADLAYEGEVEFKGRKAKFSFSEPV